MLIHFVPLYCNKLLAVNDDNITSDEFAIDGAKNVAVCAISLNVAPITL